MSTTPRTDAQYKEYARRDNNVKCVDIDFARQLETELIALQEEVNQYKAAQEFICCVYCKLKISRDTPDVLAGHILSCEKSPLVELLKKCESSMNSLEKERDQLLATVEGLKQAGEMLWIVVANVSEGNWDKQSKEWQEAAARWRDNYFINLQSIPPTNLVKRSVLEKLINVALMDDEQKASCGPICSRIIEEAREELERTKS